MEESRKLREEAAICRELAREIHDPPSIAMFLERAAELEARADALDANVKAGRVGTAQRGERPLSLHAEIQVLSRR